MKPSIQFARSPRVALSSTLSLIVLSAFCGKGKKLHGKLNVYPEAIRIFANLRVYPPIIGNEEQSIL